MSETPDERRERLVRKVMASAVKAWHLPPGIHDVYAADDVLDALLSVLEPPVADMVRRGVFSMQHERTSPVWYRPWPERDDPDIERVEVKEPGWSSAPSPDRHKGEKR